MLSFPPLRGPRPELLAPAGAPAIGECVRASCRARPSKALEGYSPFKTTDLRDPVLGEIAERQGVTPAQVVIRAASDHEVVVIPKSASPERIASNFDVFGFALDDAKLHQIDGLSGDVCGDKQPPCSFRIFHSDYCS